MKSKRFAILGASRGLGSAFVKVVLEKNADIKMLLFSRKLKVPSENKNVKCVRADFSKTGDQQNCLKQLHAFQPHGIFYFAGGGPFGHYQKKEWKDHQWSWEVSFCFPAQIIHYAMGNLEQSQMVFIGSNVCEEQPDPMAASYAAGKQPLDSFIHTLKCFG